MEQKTNLKPADYLQQYYGDLAMIKEMRNKVKNLQPKTTADVDLKLDTEIKIKKLSQECLTFKRSVFADLTLREIYFLCLYYSLNLPLKEIATKINRCAEGMTAYKNNVMRKFTTALERYLNKGVA